MFHTEGADRPHRHNQIIAGFLAVIAGFVNSAGFVLVGFFTSHVTGNVGRFADDLALGHSSAVLAAMLVLAYFGGAFGASAVLESNVLADRATAYALLLAIEVALLAAFIVPALGLPHPAPLISLPLGVAMGLQNALVTRLSGAVVRTTHMTGVVTDLGIELARWFRHSRGQLAARSGIRLVAGSAPPVAPSRARTTLLVTILGAFVVGSALGALATTRFGALALGFPALALAAGSGYALRARRRSPPQ